MITVSISVTKKNDRLKPHWFTRKTTSYRPVGGETICSPADSSSTRGGFTSVRGRVRSPHMAKLQAARGAARLGLGQTDGRIAVSLNALIGRGHNNNRSRVNVITLPSHWQDNERIATVIWQEAASLPQTHYCICVVPVLWRHPCSRAELTITVVHCFADKVRVYGGIHSTGHIFTARERGPWTRVVFIWSPVCFGS